MDDFMPYLLHQHGIIPRNVSIVFDNPSLDALEETTLASSLQNLPEEKAVLPDLEGSTCRFNDSFMSVDVSRQLLSPVKGISPSSVLDDLHITSTLQKMDSKFFMLDEEHSECEDAILP
jgi:hypothetical protein